MKTITSNSRTEDQFSLLHLFEFDIYTLAGAFEETLYFTDFDIFVDYDSNEYTPLSITFDRLSEDITMQSNSISIIVDNINEELSTVAITKEWRNNPARIKRVIFTPPSETPGDGNTYPYGYGDNLDVYPKISLGPITKDVYTLFSGYIDSFSATDQSVTASISTKFIHWRNPFPKRTFSQNEYNSVIQAMTETTYWGRTKDVY